MPPREVTAADLLALAADGAKISKDEIPSKIEGFDEALDLLREQNELKREELEIRKGELAVAKNSTSDKDMLKFAKMVAVEIAASQPQKPDYTFKMNENSDGTIEVVAQKKRETILQ